MILQRYLAELSDLGKPIVASKLINLSSLSSDEAELFKTTWATIDVGRRRAIVGRLLEVAADNFELDFDDVFRACLGDRDEQVRIKAIRGLGQCEDRCLIDPLIGLLRGDKEESVRAAAATALGNFALLAEFQKLRPSDAAKVGSALLAAIDDPREQLEVRRRAIEAIGSLSQPRVKQIIREAYESDVPELRAAALCAMGQNCDPAWFPILLRELRSPNPEMRFEAAAACGQLEEQSAVPHLIELIHDPDPQVRLSAIEALGRIGGGEAKQGLREYMNSPDETIRGAAEEALEELGFGEEPLSFNFQ